MIWPRLSVFILLLAIAGCGDSAPTEATNGNSGSANVPDPGVTTNTDSEIAFVQKRFERVLAMENLGSLRCDTLRYTCGDDANGGSFTFCYLGQDLVRAATSTPAENKEGGRETYYYDDADLYYADLSQSTWAFAPADTGNGTVEEVSEERRYYYNGNLIERLYRDYRTQSWTDNPDPTTLPELRTGKGVNERVTGGDMLTVATDRTYECP